MSQIVAIVTMQREGVGGGAPLFFARNREEFGKLAFLLEKILEANAHELSPETMILVRHGAEKN